jgi:predicted ATPase/DNA-binding winged helix-turn-helix (wHTH) protein
MRFGFDRCVFDTEAVRLVVDGVDVAIQPQVAGVLEVLLAERHRVVSKRELLERVWGHTFVTESALTSRIKSARRAIGDDGQAQRLIRTVHGRGYQFIGAVHEHERTPAPAQDRPPPRSLPTFGTTLIGRDADIAGVEALLDSARLVTIVGTGGVGKTRLAVEVARRRSTPSAFVDLTLVGEPSLVTEQIARTLGLGGPSADASAAVIELASDRPLLLVVDNVEHVIAAGVELGALTRSDSQLAIIATSREPLRVEGEVVYPLEPLAVPRQQGPVAASVLLFERTARSLDPSFDLSAHRASVEQICTAVDGLPLAVELAASHVRTLPPPLLLPRLDQRLRSPSGARRDAPDRQRTMADTIEWSLQLLGAAELTVFARLGVFCSAVPLEVIEAAVGGEPIDDPVGVLGRLVDRSLVRRIATTDGPDRFDMLALLRERAGQLLDAGDDVGHVRARHADAVAHALEDLRDRHWIDARSRELTAALVREASTAFEFARANDRWQLAARLVGALALHRHRDGGHAEARRWLDAVRPHLATITDPPRAWLLLAAGFDCWHHDEQEQARTAWADAARRFEDLGDEQWLAYTLVFLGLTDNAVTGGDTQRGVARVEEAVRIARSVSRSALLAAVLVVAGEFFRMIGDYANAGRRYVEAVRTAELIGDQATLSVAVANLSYVASHDGDFLEGRRLGRRGLELSIAAGRRQFAAWSVSELAESALGLGEPVLGARLIGAAERALHAMGGRIYPGDLATHERVIAGLVESLGTERYEHEYTLGSALSLDQAIRLALGEDCLDAADVPTTG